MVSVSQIAGQNTLQRIRQIQAITIAWMTVETCVSLSAAWVAHSPALIAFGGDSAIELLSAAVVLWRFRARRIGEHAEQKAEERSARIAGCLLFALAAFVAAASTMSLAGRIEPRPTYWGIAILVAAVIVMPWLTREKRRLSAATGSAALRADAAQSGLCAYLSLIALAGLAANVVWHVTWADPIAALAITPLILWEGKEAIRGKPCGCC